MKVKRTTIALILIAFVVAMVNCGGGGSSSGGMGTSKVTITISDSNFAKIEVRKSNFFAYIKGLFKRVIDIREAFAIPSNVVNIRYTVSGPDMDTITGIVPVAGSTMTFTINVPNGPQRHFVIEALDANGVVIYIGEAYADLDGTRITLPIDMQSLTSVFVTNNADNTVSIIDAPTNTVIATIPVGSSPVGVAVNPVTKRAYVANFESSDVSVLDTVTNIALGAPISVGGGKATPYGIAVNPNNNRIYVTNEYNGGDIYWIDGATNTPGTISVTPAYSFGVAIHPNTNIAYVVDWGWVYTVDTNTNMVVGSEREVSGGYASAFGAAIDPVANIVIVTDTGGNLNFIDSSDGVTTLAVGETSLEGVAIDKNTHRAYVANNGGDSVLVVDIISHTVVNEIPVGTAPLGVAIDPATKRVYVANSGSNNVSVIDTTTNTVIATIPVGNTPKGVAIFFRQF